MKFRHNRGKEPPNFAHPAYLLDADAYIECTVMKQSNVSRKNQKVRKLRERYGEVVAVLYRRDFQRLRRKYGRGPAS